jgi:hypothetical protein
MDGSMPGMGHCDGMTRTASARDSGQHSLQALQGCPGMVCGDDFSFTKDHAAFERTGVALQTYADASPSASFLLPVLMQTRLHQSEDRSTSAPSNLAPLISKLRI